ncbi:hypothetical protein KIN20_014595 [Parelaphostrongylus tenuis]|uniref:Myosin tail domain-containing protein n=1 Tax=Parelaphostrongylus tenuis TaxID=148309 RepID=A0AAD5QPE7_PARTN|nr:hypothetical protein KIN20_009989 [Parelaphostrongylus tenuis]KAJ1356799.1 hypothetical protein KIN20_014595 [Parelaphostrongylus tenuis]
MQTAVNQAKDACASCSLLSVKKQKRAELRTVLCLGSDLQSESDLQSRLNEALEDLRQKQSLRTKVEKARRVLTEEVQSYKLELEKTQGKTASHHAMTTKRQKECSLLQKQLSESMREADERCVALRVKYQKQIEELEEQMDILKRSKAAMTENQFADQSLHLQQCSEEREQLVAKVGKAIVK